MKACYGDVVFANTFAFCHDDFTAGTMISSYTAGAMAQLGLLYSDKVRYRWRVDHELVIALPEHCQARHV